MSEQVDSVETLRLTVEKLHHTSARFKEKRFVPEVREGDQAWEGDVFSFELTYNTKAGGATREQIAAWRLPGPTAEALDAAVQRGLKIKKKLETEHARNPESRRKAKLAYAWMVPVKGRGKRRVNVVLHEGAVKSPIDAVKAALGKENRKG